MFMVFLPFYDGSSYSLRRAEDSPVVDWVVMGDSWTFTSLVPPTVYCGSQVLEDPLSEETFVLQ